MPWRMCFCVIGFQSVCCALLHMRTSGLLCELCHGVCLGSDNECLSPNSIDCYVQHAGPVYDLVSNMCCTDITIQIGNPGYSSWFEDHQDGAGKRFLGRLWCKKRLCLVGCRRLPGIESWTEAPYRHHHAIARGEHEALVMVKAG